MYIYTIPYLMKSHHRLFSPQSVILCLKNQFHPESLHKGDIDNLMALMTSIFDFFKKKDDKSLSIPKFCWYRIPDHWTKVSNSTFTKSDRVDIGNTKFLRFI